MSESLVISADLYKYWHVDYETGTVRIVCQDGRVFDDRLGPRHQRHDSLVATSTFDWEKWWILSTTTKDDLIITEGFNPASAPPLNGRPSVYLDQNRWRTVADVVHDPARVKTPKNDAQPRTSSDSPTTAGLCSLSRRGTFWRPRV